MGDYKIEGRVLAVEGEGDRATFTLRVPAQVGHNRAGETFQFQSCTCKARLCKRMRDGAESVSVGALVAALMDPDQGERAVTIIHSVGVTRRDLAG